MASLFLHELRSRSTAIVGWGLGISAFAIMIILIYPDFEGQLASFNIDEIDFYQIMGDFGEFNSFIGFISAELFTFIPVLLCIYAIVNGTGTIAGEEDSGTLEPLMALPLPRWQLVTTKAVGLGIALLLILFIVSIAAVVAFSTLPSDVNVGGVEASDLILATMTIWPLVMLFAMLSLFLGTFLPSRRLAATVATLLLIITYFGNNLTGMVQFLEPLKPIFPFNYYSGRSILEGGIDRGDMLVLLAAGLVLFVLALISFQRRNVTVGAWPWQRARVSSRSEA